MSKIKALLLDLDGTLIDSVPDLADAVNVMLKQLGFAIVSDELVRSWVGNGALLLVKRALANACNSRVDTLNDANIEKALVLFKDSYRENCCHRSELYPRVLETLEKLQQQGIKMAIVTNKPVEFANTIVRYYGLDQYCSVVLGGDSLATHKPNPAMLIVAAKELDLRVDECIMLGDSAADVNAATNAHIPCYIMTYGYNGGQDLLALGAQQGFDEFADIEQVLV